MKKKIRSAIRITIFLLLGLFFIWFFLRNLSPEEKKEIIENFFQANFWWILISAIFGLLSHVSRTLRWQILLRSMGYTPRFINTFFAIMIGYFANLALPRLGEVSKCGILQRYEKVPFQKSFGTVVIERALDLIMFGLAFLINFFVHLDKVKAFKETGFYQSALEKYYSLENPGMYQILIIILIIVLLYVLYRLRHKVSHTVIYQKVKHILTGFFEGIKSLGKIKNAGWFIFHTIFIWVMYLMMTYIVFFSLEETGQLSIGAGLAVLVFGTVGIMVVQGGIGIYPWIVAETLVAFSIAPTIGYALGWLLWIGQTVLVIISGLISMILLPVFNSKK